MSNTNGFTVGPIPVVAMPGSESKKLFVALKGLGTGESIILTFETEKMARTKQTGGLQTIRTMAAKENLSVRSVLRAERLFLWLEPQL